jgi:uracil-DNA glycosylase family 4
MNAPELTRLQIAWLQEIGIDRRMLAHYVPRGEFDAPVKAADVAPQRDPSAGPSATAGVPVRKTPSRADTVLPRPAVIAPPAAVEAVVLRASVPSDWKGMLDQVMECRACPLHSARGRVVFGSGDAEEPQLMIVGEAPGGSDDRAGLPFQGKAGVLLQAMLAAAGLNAETAFYTNLVKCRPLGNRPPTSDEVEACMPYLQRQIALAKPRHILALGSWAAKALLGVETELDSLRGDVHTIRTEAGDETSLVVTYHPAVLLLRPQHKADAWRDLALLRALVARGLTP